MDSPCKEAEEHPPVLPDELIEDIFARMPAKLAHRCRCLSRAWSAALSSRSFIDRHLRLANRRDGSRCRSLLFLPDYDQVTDTTVHAWSPGRPLVAVGRDKRLRRVAAVTRQCRGLVVLQAGRRRNHTENYFLGLDSVYKVDYYVCNPSTGQMTALPKGEDAFGLSPYDHDSLGIGYDASIQKHKVVRIYCRGMLPPACQVCVLNSTVERWRPPAGAADRAMPPGFVTNYSTDQSVFAQGYLYWCARPDKEKREKIIISFSISEEVFGILPPPPLMPSLLFFDITELDGRLCLFDNNDRYMRLFDIWVLHDHQAGTWGIHSRIDLERPSFDHMRSIWSPRLNPLDIVDDGSHILLRPDPHDVRKENAEAHRLYVYRPATGDVEDLLNDGGVITHHTMAWRVAVPYEESLESTGLSDTGRSHELDDKRSKDSSSDKDNRNLRPENILSKGGRLLISEVDYTSYFKIFDGNSAASSPGLSPSSSMGFLSSDKSTLNPNAKEFKLNPNAKSFTPFTSPLRPPNPPAPDATYYYPNNMPTTPGPGLPVGMGFPQAYGGQPMVYNAQPGSFPQGYTHPSGQQYGQQMMMGQTCPVYYYAPEMQQYRGGRN